MPHRRGCGEARPFTPAEVVARDTATRAGLEGTEVLLGACQSRSWKCVLLSVSVSRGWGKRGSRMADEITFDDCCRIILRDWPFRRDHIVPALRDYKRHLLALLTQEFGIEWHHEW